MQSAVKMHETPHVGTVGMKYERTVQGDGNLICSDGRVELCTVVREIDVLDERP